MKIIWRDKSGAPEPPLMFVWGVICVVITAFLFGRQGWLMASFIGPTMPGIVYVFDTEISQRGEHYWIELIGTALHVGFAVLLVTLPLAYLVGA